ncbi:MAG: hypothetical protein IK104_04865 [Clostridia bacterium]|nr:hypothetical protein [Clostridia bacterium]
MAIMDVASSAIQKVTARYGKKVRRDVIRQDIARNGPLTIAGECYRVGFAMDDIMPPENSGKTYYIAGHGSGHKMEGVLTPAYIHALWVDCGGSDGMLWLSADIVGLTNVEVERIRAKIAGSKIIKGCRSVNVSCTHSHSGLDTVGYWGKPFLSIPSDGKDPEYMEMLFEKALRTAEVAFLTRRPGVLYAGQAPIPGGLKCKRPFTDRHEVLYRLRFHPDDGSRDVFIVNVGAHPNSLGGNNRMLSGEFPYYMREEIKKLIGADVFFGIGAIGGMDAADLDGKDPVDTIKKQGKFYADAAVSITDERELKPEIRFLRRQFYLPVDNNVLLFLAMLGTMSFRPFPDDRSATGVAMKTEMTYMTFGDQKILLLPGECFVTTVYGGYRSAEESATGLGPEVNAQPLAEIAGDPDLIVFGVTNDMTGYSVDRNEFILHPTEPYLETARDRFDERHYHETNSMGPETQRAIADAFAEVVEDFG